MQSPHVGRFSSHFFRRVLQFVQPLDDLEWWCLDLLAFIVECCWLWRLGLKVPRLHWSDNRLHRAQGISLEHTVLIAAHVSQAVLLRPMETANGVCGQSRRRRAAGGAGQQFIRRDIECNNAKDLAGLRNSSIEAECRPLGASGGRSGCTNVGLSCSTIRLSLRRMNTCRSVINNKRSCTQESFDG